MSIYEDLKYRGLIKDFSNEEKIKAMLDNGHQTIYCGFDPSATSMHMGNLVMVLTLVRLQNAGHKIIPLVGGGTGMIGDPSGRSSERNLLDENAIKENTRLIRNQLSKFIDLTNVDKGELLNNYDWLSKISYLEFLRDYGKYFTVNYMLAKDTVARRLETGISYTEFSYMLLQAVDFLHLHENYGVSMQIGGSDQWGNLVTGIDLIKKVKGNETAVEVMTAHLLTNSAGEKFGKSLGGALYLDGSKFSPYKLYQYFLNVSDEDAYRYLKVFTFLTKEEIEALNKEHSLAPHNRLAQTKLAEEVLLVVHDNAALESSKKMSEALFSGNLTSLSEEEIKELFSDMTKPLSEDLLLEDVLITLGVSTSKRDARELIKGNSISVNGTKVNDPLFSVSKQVSLFNQYVIIRKGKKHYFVGKM